jgi:hypothetical protein
VTVRESVTIAGRPERARVAREFVGEVLGPGHLRRADAVLQGAGHQRPESRLGYRLRPADLTYFVGGQHRSRY